MLGFPLSVARVPEVPVRGLADQLAPPDTGSVMLASLATADSPNSNNNTPESRKGHNE